MLPTEVSLALEALSRDGWSSYLVAYRPSSPPHVFTDMDSATRHHLGLGTGPSSMEVEELREDSSYLFEYIWREKVKREGGDHFLSLLGLLAGMRTRMTPAEELPQYFLAMEEPLWDCIYCGLEMSSKEEQRLHVQRDCKERPAWDHWCIYCGLEFSSQTGLSMHVARWCKEK